MPCSFIGAYPPHPAVAGSTITIILHRAGPSIPRTSDGGLAIDHPLALPPGFRALAGEDDPWEAALRTAALGAATGSLYWNEVQGLYRAAIVFAPDHPLGRTSLAMGPDLLNLGAVALFDALAVLAPPQVPMHLLLPDSLAVDGGRVATLRLAQAPSLDDAASHWAVLGIDVSVDLQAAAPGNTPDRTCLAAEGFGEVTAAELMAHVCRHLLCWADTWREDGGRALAQAVSLRTLRAPAAA